MSSRHHIDDFMRGRIIGKIEEGRKITDVAREFDIAHSVVSRRQIYRPISKKEQAHHSSEGGKSVSCCLRKADLPKNCCQTFEEERTIRTQTCCVCPLTRQHRTARLQWCREHHNWNEQDWACVRFSD
ncbi:hypothetical protein TNCV_1390011 [Trichonephila clavipes]|nr:hypothetical protein TNCV_1390011 [Trichonephila clavipes]